MTTQTTQAIRLLQQQAASLLLYQTVLENPVGRAFLELLNLLATPQSNRMAVLWAYGQWFRQLAEQGQSWQTFLLHQILQADNPFTQQAQRQAIAQLPTGLVAAAWHDLRALQQLYRCHGQQIGEWVGAIASLDTPPVIWNGTPTPDPPSIYNKFETAEDWTTVLEALAAHYQEAGVGAFAQYRAFRWQNGILVGIEHPDPIRLDALVGYEMQRDVLVKNTEALLAGYPALHVLLYGSRGSGKSSMVKGLLHWSQTKAAARRPLHPGDDFPRDTKAELVPYTALRLIEVAKADLRDLPLIIDTLRDSPQKFILFVDDLSFEEDDEAFKSLKVVLEGNVTARPQNIVVYATSNRRHLVREYFADRPRPRDADEVNSWDTVQEKLSFSDRFGITLTFEPADQTTYLAIVRHLTAQAGIAIAPQDLEFRALQWATRHNGRSGRTARQFVDFLKAETALTQ